MNKVWSIGISMLDIITQPITHFPEYGGSVNSQTTDMVLGGMALNTAVALAKIGKAPVGLISCIGEDNSGKFLKEGLENLHVDISRMCYTRSASTGTAICFIHPGGERSMVLCLAANNQLTEEKINPATFEHGDFLHFGGSMVSEGTRGENLARLLKKLKEKRVTISLDTCWDGTDQWGKLLNPCLPYCDILETNKEEAILYSGKDNVEDAIAFFTSFGPRIVVVKMGGEGVRIKSAEFDGTIPIFKVNTVDATGAGDSFDAGFLFGLYQHWSVEQSAIFASAVGAKCVTAFGATTGIGTYEETLDLIRSQSRLGNWNWNL